MQSEAEGWLATAILAVLLGVACYRLFKSWAKFERRRLERRD
jgi:hypothetical protein